MRRRNLFECGIGDWVGMMEGEAIWDPRCGPYEWAEPKGDIWRFALTEVPTIDPKEGQVGTDFVWMRYDPAGEIPRSPWGTVDSQIHEHDPADWWKNTSTRQKD